jgi:tetrapyrrole methylase family protein / MazG family protein
MSNRFDNLIQLMARLRAPDGCPWDRKQTHESLKPYLIEEAYEVLEAIGRSVDSSDAVDLAQREEGEGVVLAEIDPQRLQDVRRRLN